MKKGDIFRIRGGHRTASVVREEGESTLMNFGKVKKWVRTEDLMQPIDPSIRWMRPFVDGDFWYSFGRWLLSDKVEARFATIVGIVLILFVILQAVRYVSRV
jgi:hypothetical protein